MKCAVISLGAFQTATDDAGNFLLLNPPSAPASSPSSTGAAPPPPGRGSPLSIRGAVRCQKEVATFRRVWYRFGNPARRGRNCGAQTAGMRGAVGA